MTIKQIEFLIKDISYEIRNTVYTRSYDDSIERYYDTEKAFMRIAKKYNFSIVDDYGSIVGTYLEIPEFFIPNSYGQEDTWCGIKYEFDFVLLFHNKVFIAIQYKDYLEVIEQPYNIDINVEYFGGKRGYYYKKGDYVRFRTSQEFYNTLPDKNKFPEGENDISGPHFTIRFDSNIKKYILKEQ